MRGTSRFWPRGAPVSSSLLYLAIVAVWAFVLVPRWLRRHHAQPQAQPESRIDADVEVDVEFAAEYAPGPQYHYTDVQDGDARSYSAEAQEMSYDVDVDVDVEVSQLAPTDRNTRAPVSRSRVLQARRRLLTMLLLLTAVAVACTTLKLTSWWVGIPPAAMLGIYLLLLREAALADAEQARRRAELESRLWAARQRAYAAAMERDAEHSAQIIDISARVGDQLYDQYADATVRAVGD
jgi:hypothetical protein